MFIDTLSDSVAHKGQFASPSVCCLSETQGERDRALRNVGKSAISLKQEAVRHFERRAHFLTLLLFFFFFFSSRHFELRAVLPRSQSAGPDSPCWCSSAVINSLTLCAKNSNPALSSLPPFCLSLSQSLPFVRPISAVVLLLIPSCPLGSISLSPLLHSARLTSFRGLTLGGFRVCVSASQTVKHVFFWLMVKRTNFSSRLEVQLNVSHQ